MGTVMAVEVGTAGEAMAEEAIGQIEEIGIDTMTMGLRVILVRAVEAMGAETMDLEVAATIIAHLGSVLEMGAATGNIVSNRASRSMNQLKKTSMW